MGISDNIEKFKVEQEMENIKDETINDIKKLLNESPNHFFFDEQSFYIDQHGKKFQIEELTNLGSPGFIVKVDGEPFFDFKLNIPILTIVRGKIQKYIREFAE